MKDIGRSVMVNSINDTSLYLILIIILTGFIS